ncbi:MAG: hypothetical protein MUE46_06910 [Xanthomonadales bacterium]|jgi:hypothetical protein|nr:hypothetical protein [Xanthomonadales bacterium]
MSWAAALRTVPGCPACGSTDAVPRGPASPNLYSEQLALLLGVAETELLATVTNVECRDCGVWWKPRWFAEADLRRLFGERVPDHPKGWDAGSGGFSAAALRRQVAAYAAAQAAGDALAAARAGRTLRSILLASAAPTAATLLAAADAALAAADAAAVTALADQAEAQGVFAAERPFSRFVGFGDVGLWDWLTAELGPIRRLGEVGCPQWGFLVRPCAAAVERVYLRRAEANYWAEGCRRGGVHCLTAACGSAAIAVDDWAAAPALGLDLLGAYQYLDHLEDPRGFLTEALAAAPALLLILDGIDQPTAIQHVTGWTEPALTRLARAAGGRLAAEYAPIRDSGNRAWLIRRD